MGSWLLWTDMICACIPAERGTSHWYFCQEEAPYVLCLHYVQDYEYEKIVGDIEEFLQAKM